MANPPAIDLAALHAAIKTKLRAQFPSSGGGAVPTIDYYVRAAGKIVTPAILFQLESVEPGGNEGDDGTEQFDGTLRFSAYCIYAFSADDVASKLNTRVLAMALAAFVRGQRWGISGCLPARIIGAMPDDFTFGVNGAKEQVDSYNVWRLDWANGGFFGASVWNPDGSITPTTVYLGLAPDVGVNHVADYVQIAPAP